MTKKSNAWGHTLRPLTEDEIQRQIDRGKWLYEYVHSYSPDIADKNGQEYYINFGRKCCISKKCNNLSMYMLKYYYITGSRGNVSYTERPICEAHARKYQKNHTSILK
jgi:hypothetical protein